MYENRFGRFTAVDPLLASGKSANPQTFNRYIYVGNNPILLVDPNGEDWHVSWIKVNGKWYTKPEWYGGRGRGPKWNSVWSDGKHSYSTSWVFLDALTNKFVGLDPYSSEKKGGLSESEAQTAFNGYVNRGIKNYLTGAADNLSLTFWLGRKALGYEANEDHDTYKVGSGVGLTGSIVALPASGASGIVNFGVSRTAKLIVGSSAAGGKILPMTVVRLIEKGQNVEELVSEAKGLTWNTGKEHALVTLADGRRALVSGGEGGIHFEAGQIKRIWAHTHPDPSFPSVEDQLILQVLGNSKQRVFNVGTGNVTTVRRSN